MALLLDFTFYVSLGLTAYGCVAMLVRHWVTE